jgi:hypothetical protein
MGLVEGEKDTGSDKGESMKAANILIAEVVDLFCLYLKKHLTHHALPQTFGRELSRKEESNEVRIQLWWICIDLNGGAQDLKFFVVPYNWNNQYRSS